MSFSVRPVFAADERVRAPAVAAEVALGDSEGDLLAHLGVERATGECAGKVEIAFERGGGIGQHAGPIRDDAELGWHGVEELLGFAGGLSGVELSDAVHIRSFVFSFCFFVRVVRFFHSLITCRAMRVIPLKTQQTLEFLRTQPLPRRYEYS